MTGLSFIFEISGLEEKKKLCACGAVSAPRRMRGVSLVCAIILLIVADVAVGLAPISTGFETSPRMFGRESTPPRTSAGYPSLLAFAGLRVRTSAPRQALPHHMYASEQRRAAHGLCGLRSTAFPLPGIPLPPAATPRCNVYAVPVIVTRMATKHVREHLLDPRAPARRKDAWMEMHVV